MAHWDAQWGFYNGESMKPAASIRWNLWYVREEVIVMGGELITVMDHAARLMFVWLKLSQNLAEGRESQGKIKGSNWERETTRRKS